MADGGEHPFVSRPVTEKLLVTVADKLDQQHLREFATTLIGLGAAEYKDILKDAREDEGKQCIAVLRMWNNKAPRTMSDLCGLVKEAERRGFVQSGSVKEVASEATENPEPTMKNVSRQSLDFAGVVALWYKSPAWQKMPLLPWMDEETLLLSEIYTEMEMEEYCGRYNKKTVVPLNGYKDLFKHIQDQGTRILVKGDPGIGKSTFVQKLAFDWATKQLVIFDVVLVVKMKFTDKTQSIARMVKDQIKPLWEDDTVSEKDIAEYMKSGRDRVLLVLDGLDEIKLKQYPQVQEVLVGERYRKCCILATTRPYVAETLNNKMTTVAKIKGFSKEQAKQFVGNILDGEELSEFLPQLDKRKISQMYRVPLIVQALALLFKEYKKLPRTYTITYDQLVFFLTKTCKQSKDLTEEEIQAAMDEVSELAFKGLIREDKQLVFSRDEIKDDNVRKLGILTAEKAGSGFNPTEVLQFAHKSVQEHSASDHVVKRLLSDDRGPWEALVEQFHKDAATKDQGLPNRRSIKITTTQVPSDRQKKKSSISHQTEEELNRKNITVRSALLKIIGAALAHPDVVKEGMDIYQKLVEAGAFDDEIDFRRVSDVLTSHPLADEVLTKEEQTTLVHYIIRELLMETPKEWRAHQKSWINILLRESKQEPNEFKKYLIDQKEVWGTLVANDPEMGKQTLLQVANVHKIKQSYANAEYKFQCRLPYQYILQEFTHLLERVQYNKTLFRFIIGKLADHPAVRDVILKEIAVLVVQHSFDADNGGVLPINEIVSFLMDLKSESLPDDDDDISESDSFLVTPALVDLRSTMKFSTMENLEPDTPCALKILGTKANIPEFIPKVTSHIQLLRKIHLVELESIECPDQDQDLSSAYKEFTRVLYQSRDLVSIQLNSLDANLAGILTQNLPSSVLRLFVGPAVPRGTFTFPPEVRLVCLFLHNCLSKVGGLFRDTAFPHLKKISIKNDSHGWEGKVLLTWTREDAKSLLEAVRTGRMPTLEEMIIRDCCLKGCGPALTEILKVKSFRSAEFVGAELSKEDGQILHKNIQDGSLDHMEYLNLLDNEEISWLKMDFAMACEQHEIRLEMFSTYKQKQSISGEQREAPKNEAPQRQFDFSAILNNVGRFFNAANPADQDEPQEPTVNPQQAGGQPRGERKRDDYIDDMDLD